MLSPLKHPLELKIGPHKFSAGRYAWRCWQVEVFGPNISEKTRIEISISWCYGIVPLANLFAHLGKMIRNIVKKIKYPFTYLNS